MEGGRVIVVVRVVQRNSQITQHLLMIQTKSVLKVKRKSLVCRCLYRFVWFLWWCQQSIIRLD